MKYLSLCSGIEAASVGFPSDWEAIAFSEIDAFPCAVLHHRFGAGRPWHMPSLDDPNLTKEEHDVRRLALKEVSRLPLKTDGLANWGDMTKFDEWPDVSIDLICGGTPCQSFSVAGLRKGLDDERGNLMLVFGHILGKYRPTWFIWENVPGVLSSHAGRDFASFLGLVTGQAIEPPTDGWRTAGVISGIDSAYGIAYRVLDAQYTRSPKHPRAVPQRRRRVFVVGHLGDWRRAAAVLLDSESLSRHPSPRRETGQGTSRATESGPRSGSHWDGGAHPPLTQSHNTGGIAMSDQELFAQRGAGLVAHAFTQEQEPKWEDSTAHTLGTYNGRKQAIAQVAHSLSADGFDASEDGTGRGTPIVAIQGTVIGRADHAGPQGSGHSEDGAMFTLTKTDQHAVAIRAAQTSANAVAFQSKASAHQSMNPSDVSPSLDVGKSDGVAVALALRQREGKPGGGKGPLVFEEHSGTLATSNDQTLLTPQMAVRRLLPVECERLQGFEDGHTDVPYRNKPNSPDGPRYKAIGNSMATNCMEIIGVRIQQVEALKELAMGGHSYGSLKELLQDYIDHANAQSKKY